MNTLDTLIRVSRNYRVKRRELCCPACGRQVFLIEGQLMCEGVGEMCNWTGEKLAELAVRGKGRAA